MASPTMASPHTAEVLLVSPETPSRPPLSSSRKRQITPSSEVSSAKKTAVVTTAGAISSSQSTVDRSAFANPLGWPPLAEQAQIDARWRLHGTTIPNPLFQGAPAQHQKKPRHIILPFDLRVDLDALAKPENQAILASIFPENISISTDGMFLHFHQSKMPPKPWPKTVGGLPLYISPGISPQPSPLPDPRPVHRRNGSIASDLNGRELADWDRLFEVIRAHFQDLDVSITEVMYWGSSVIIVLEHRGADITKLPWKAANIPCLYLYDDDMGRPSFPQPRRLTDPMPGNPDHSEYDTLQPGLRVSSAYLPSQPDSFLCTTAGVLVRDQHGGEFMAVASHGFPHECDTVVNHPLPTQGRNLGEPIMEVSHTDITLVKLRDTENFLNITFQNENFPHPVQLKRLASVKNRRRWDPVVLDSPDTGCIDGTLMCTSFQRVPIDDHNAPNQQWIFTTWQYMGQESAIHLSDGMCGSAIWTEEGDVLGFFRYASKAGAMTDWCSGIAADELIQRGYTLVDTANRMPSTPKLNCGSSWHPRRHGINSILTTLEKTDEKTVAR